MTREGIKLPRKTGDSVEEIGEDISVAALNRNPDDAAAYDELASQLFTFKTKKDFEQLERITDTVTRLKLMRDLVSIADIPSMRMVSGLARRSLENGFGEVEKVTDAQKKIQGILLFEGIFRNEKLQSLWSSLTDQDIDAYIRNLLPREMWHIKEMIRIATEPQRQIMYNYLLNIPREEFSVAEHLQRIERYNKTAKYQFFDGIQNGAPKELKAEFASYTAEVLEDYLSHPIDGDMIKTIEWLVEVSYSTPGRIFSEAIRKHYEQRLTQADEKEIRQELEKIVAAVKPYSFVHSNICNAITTTIGKILKRKK